MTLRIKNALRKYSYEILSPNKETLLPDNTLGEHRSKKNVLREHSSSAIVAPRLVDQKQIKVGVGDRLCRQHK
jgi:hypothetical protein